MRKTTYRATACMLALGIAFAFAAHGAANPPSAAPAAAKDAPAAPAGGTTLVNTIAGAKYAVATFAGGCFWTMERAFDKVPGVIKAISGYSGGHVRNPSYDEVSTGTTGHVETVEVHYDPAKISYAQLLDIYWHDIDPTQVGGQACDIGDEYRSVIFTHDAEQMKQAQAYKDSLKSRFAKPVAVQIVAAHAFYPAEEYHQQFTIKNPQYYEQYRVGCGRDRRLQAVWGTAAHK
jgi:peptide-methionine (S)-S-oxide reductase